MFWKTPVEQSLKYVKGNARALLCGAGTIACLSLAPYSSVFAQATPDVSFENSDPVTLENSISDDKELDAQLDLSFNGNSAEAEPGYLYFNQTPTTVASFNASPSEILSITPKPEETFTPHFGEAVAGVEALTVLGDDWLRNSFTPRQADAHLSFGYKPGDEEGTKLGIGLSSSVQVEEVGMPGVVNNPSLNSAMNRQTYRLGLNIGYSGFNIGATIREDQSVYADTTSGYGVGLSYTGASWTTSLNVGEYSRKYKNLFTSFGDSKANFQTVEIGASYRLNRTFSFSGGMRYLSFDAKNDYSLFDRPEAQVFYLGTNFNF